MLQCCCYQIDVCFQTLSQELCACGESACAALGSVGGGCHEPWSPKSFYHIFLSLSARVNQCLKNIESRTARGCDGGCFCEDGVCKCSGGWSCRGALVQKMCFYIFVKFSSSGKSSFKNIKTRTGWRGLFASGASAVAAAGT